MNVRRRNKHTTYSELDLNIIRIQEIEILFLYAIYLNIIKLISIVLDTNYYLVLLLVLILQVYLLKDLILFTIIDMIILK